MTRTEAFAIAQNNCKAYKAADLEAMFGRAPEPKNADYGHRHGWFTVGKFSFPDYELEGRPMNCQVQAQWAYL